MFEVVSKVLERFKRVKSLKNPNSLLEENFHFEGLLGSKEKGQFKRLSEEENEFHTFKVEKGVPRKLSSSEMVLKTIQTRVYVDHENGLARVLFLGESKPVGIKTSFEELNGHKTGKYELEAPEKSEEHILEIKHARRSIGKAYFQKGRITEVQVDKVKHLLEVLKAMRRVD